MLNISTSATAHAADGVWVEYMGSKLKIAHMGNMRFQRTFSSLQRPYKKRIDKGSLDPETALEIMSKAMGEAILVDWKNVSIDGQEVPYSSDVASQAIQYDAGLREFVQEFALDYDNFRKEEIAEAGK